MTIKHWCRYKNKSAFIRFDLLDSTFYSYKLISDHELHESIIHRAELVIDNLALNNLKQDVSLQLKSSMDSQRLIIYEILTSLRPI